MTTGRTTGLLCVLLVLCLASVPTHAEPAWGRAPTLALVELLGVRVVKPTPVLVEQLGLPADRGLLIEYVRPNSAAEKAGLKLHDILMELDGKPLTSNASDFPAALAVLKPNVPVPALVIRKGRPETIKAFSRPAERGE